MPARVALCHEGHVRRVAADRVDGHLAHGDARVLANDSLCNGVDDDCDGTVDEDCTPSPASQTFFCTGGPQTYEIPHGTTSLGVDVRGGRGATAENGAGGIGGAGAWLIATIPVKGQTTLTVDVGCDATTSRGAFGWSTGGDGYADDNQLSANGGGGGGSSAIRVGDGFPIVIAGGGGGGGGNNLSPRYHLGGQGGDGSQGGQPGNSGWFAQYSRSSTTGDNAGGCGGCQADGTGQDAVGDPSTTPWGGGGGGGGGWAGGGAGATEQFTPFPHEPFPYDNAGGGGGGSSYAGGLSPVILASPTSGQITISPSPPIVRTFSCADGLQSLTVPDVGVDEMLVYAVGASGITPPANSGEGGLGASIAAQFVVAPGDELWVQAGCQSVDGAGGVGMANGGARGGGIGTIGYDGGGGGGASGILPTNGDTTLQVWAGGGGGGGGGGAINDGGDGSAGGAPTATPGGRSSDNGGGCAASTCGAGLSGEHGHDASHIADLAGGGGGGGGGWNGGGGGHAADARGGGEGAGGGGGGDSFVSPDASLSTFTVAPMPGEGTVTVLMFYDHTAARIAPAAGGTQSTTVGAAFPTRPAVLVTDVGGKAVAGAQVVFDLTAYSGQGLAWGTFADGQTSVVATTDGSGVATAPTLFANADPGTWTFQAYLGQGPGPTSATFMLTNTLVPTTTALASSSNPSLSGGQVTFTATIAVPAGTPPCTGCTVAFSYVDAGLTIPIGTSAVGADWTAASPAIAFTADHPVTAVFSGAQFAGSEFMLTQAVLPLGLATTPAPIPYQNAFDLVATGALTGTDVTIRDGAGATVCTLRPGAQPPGCQKLVRAASTAGTEQWTASYAGSGGAASFPVTFVAQVPASVTVSVSDASPVVNHDIAVGARVLPGGTTLPVDAGTAQLRVDGAVVRGPLAVDASGAVGFGSFAFTSTGTHTLVVEFLGAAARYAPVASATTAVEVRDGVEVSLQASAIPSPYGRDLSLISGVAGPTNGPAPTGSLTFRNGDTVVCADLPLVTGLATCDVGDALPVGTYQFTATYSGDAVYGTVTSDTVPIPVVSTATTTTVTAPATVAPDQQPFDVSAMVTAADGATRPIFGTVQFFLDGQPFGPPANVANGTTGPISTSLGLAGPHTLSATFGGTPDGYAASTGETRIVITTNAAPAATGAGPRQRKRSRR